MGTEEEIRDAVAELGKTYPSSAFLLYAMGLRLRTMDYDEIFRDNVLDGPDDKKVDFFFLDRDAGLAVIGQDYQAADLAKPEPPSNKAADLNTAIAWLLDSDLAMIPSTALRTAAQELRDAIESGEVHTLEVVYVHNLSHSKNVDDELATVQKSLQAKLDAWTRTTSKPLTGIASQVSFDEVEEWFADQSSPIRVDDTLKFEASTEPQTILGKDWKSVFANISADQLVALVKTYGDDVYSANVRDYLGTRASSRNINWQIGKTAEETPENFWVFNNGISVLTRSVSTKAQEVECRGIAVINGAQTLGSLADASEKADLSAISLLVRVVESNNPELIQEVIRYNNTQNPIKPWELRAIDQVQQRLQKSFNDTFGLVYQLRRGTSRWTAQEVHFEKLGPWLSAFYGDPRTAHRNRPELFDNDAKYSSLFNANSDVHNLLFVYRLGQAVGGVKDELRAAIDAGTASETQSQQYGYFRYGAFTYVLIYLCAEALRAVLNAAGANFAARVTMPATVLQDAAKSYDVLKPIVLLAIAPLPGALKEKDAYDEFKTAEGVERLADRVRVSIEQLQALHANAFDSIRSQVQLLP